jgi:hypothetical protein
MAPAKREPFYMVSRPSVRLSSRLVVGSRSREQAYPYKPTR